MGKRTNTAKWDEKHNRWRIAVQKDGVRRQFYSSKPGRTGQREANKKADNWLDDGVQNSRQRVDEVYPVFLKEKEDTTSLSNYLPMQGRWKNHIQPIIGKKYIGSLTESDLQAVINHSYATKKLSKKSLMNIKGDLTSFMKYCRIAKISSLMPESLSIPAAASRSSKTVLQPDDFVTLFTQSNTLYKGKEVPEPFIHAYRLAVLTGMRPGEIIGLQWKDVKPDRIELHRSINRYNEVTVGKNENARRVVELSSLAKKEIDAQRSQCKDTSPDASVFCIGTGANYEKHLTRYCEYNNIPRCTPYELRHTFVSIAKVLPTGLVKSIVGHSKNMDTFGVYGHELEGDAVKRVAALDAAFSKILQG